MLKLKTTICLLAVLLGSFAAASAAERETETVEKMVVTATKSERSVDLVPAAVTVITREEIELMPAQGGVDDLLQDLAGVWVRNTSGINSDGASNSVYMRGMGGVSKQGRILVLKDGVPLNDVHGGYVEFNEIAVDDVERIEIVRGPVSSLYGSQAMGGVINIITRKPEKDMRTEVESSYGTFNTWSNRLRNSATIGKFSYTVSGEHLGSDGYKEIPKDKRTATKSAKSSVERDNYSGKLRYEFDSTCALELSGNHHRNRRNGKYNLIQDFHLYEEDIDRFDLHFNKQWGALELQTTVYTSDLKSGYDHARTGSYDYVDYRSKTHGKDLGGSLQLGFSLSESQFLTLGGDYRKADLDKRYNYLTSSRIRKSGGEQDIYSLFIQDEVFLFAEKLVVNLGVRYDLWKSSAGYGLDTNTSATMVDYDDRTDKSLNPKIAARYRLTDWLSLRGSVGTAFRTPTLPNLYQGDYSYGVTVYRGNPDLESESSISYEFGIDLQITPDFSVKTTVYQTNIDDSINLITTDSVNHIKQYVNIGEVEIRGLELEAEYRFNALWSLYGNYTYNDSKIDKFEDNPALEGKYLPWLPKYQGSVGVVYSNPELLTLRLNGRYVGKIYDDDLNTKDAGDYFTADLKVSRQLTDVLEASLEATNIFDKDYQDSQSVQNPGRILMASVKLKF